MRRVAVYVDGFNLYFGMKASFGRRYHWLDLEKLAHSLLLPDQTLTYVKYFTARVVNDPPAEHRQDRYLQALAAHCPSVQVIEGRFLKKSIECRRCGAQSVRYEEKESDVSLAVALVEDAALDAYDQPLLVSADSDLCPAVRSVARIKPGCRTIAVFPPARRSPVLERSVHDVWSIDRARLLQSQLPAEIVTPRGIKLSRPAHWT